MYESQNAFKDLYDSIVIHKQYFAPFLRFVSDILTSVCYKGDPESIKKRAES